MICESPDRIAALEAELVHAKTEHREAAAAERARIVGWLRKEAYRYRPETRCYQYEPMEMVTLKRAATAIEQGVADAATPAPQNSPLTPAAWTCSILLDAAGGYVWTLSRRGRGCAAGREPTFEAAAEATRQALICAPKEEP